MPVVRTYGRAYGHEITQISRMDGSPNFLGYGASLARAPCARGAPLLREIVGESAMTPTTLKCQKSLSPVPISASDRLLRDYWLSSYLCSIPFSHRLDVFLYF